MHMDWPETTSEDLRKLGFEAGSLPQRILDQPYGPATHAELANVLDLQRREGNEKNPAYIALRDSLRILMYSHGIRALGTVPKDSLERKGQALANRCDHLTGIRVIYSKAIRGSAVDPFYDNNKIGAFFMSLDYLITKCPNIIFEEVPSNLPEILDGFIEKNGWK